MADFQGTMRIEGEGGSTVPVKARVGPEHLVLEVDGVTVGEWPVGELEARVDGGGVLLRLGEDHVMMDVTDRSRFVIALTPPSPTPSRRRRRRPSLRLLFLVLVVVGVVVAAVLQPRVVGSVGLLSGLIVLVVGTLAHSEPRVALRLPLNLQAVHLLGGGFLLVTVGVALVLVA